MKLLNSGNRQVIISSRCAVDAIKYSRNDLTSSLSGLDSTEKDIELHIGQFGRISELERTRLSNGSILYLSKEPHSWFIADSNSVQDFEDLRAGRTIQSQEDIATFRVLYSKGLLAIDGRSLKIPELSGRYIVRSDNVALVSVTDRCNLSCEHCVANANQNGLKSELTRDELKKLFFEIGRRNNELNLLVEKKVFLSGGEPLVRDDLEQIARDAHNEGLSVNICTNGLRIKEGLLESLKGLPIAFSVSLDGDMQHHEVIRGKGTYEPTIRAIRQVRNYGFDLFINTFVYQGNFQDIDMLTEQTTQLGARGINFIRAIPRGRGKGMQFKRVPDKALFEKIYLLMKSDSEFERVLKNENTFPILASSISAGVKSLSCGLSRDNYFFMDCEGNVYPCPGTRYPEFKIGNIRKEGENAVLERRKGHWFKDLNVGEFPICSDCSFTFYCGGDCRGSAYGNSPTKDIKIPVPYCHERKESLLTIFEILSRDPNFMKSRALMFERNAKEENARREYGN